MKDPRENSTSKVAAAVLIGLCGGAWKGLDGAGRRSGGAGRGTGRAASPEGHPRRAPKGGLLLEVSAVPNGDFSEGSWEAQVELGPEWLRVGSLAVASAVAMAYRRKHRLGGGNWSGGQVWDDGGKMVARVSYNGRVWEPGVWPTKEVDVKGFDEARELAMGARVSSAVVAGMARPGDVCELDLRKAPGSWAVKDVWRKGRGKVVVENVVGGEAVVSPYGDAVSRANVSVPFSALKVVGRSASEVEAGFGVAAPGGPDAKFERGERVEVEGLPGYTEVWSVGDFDGHLGQRRYQVVNPGTRHKLWTNEKGMSKARGRRAASPAMAGAAKAALEIWDGMEGMVAEEGRFPARYWKKNVEPRARALRRGVLPADPMDMMALMDDLLDGLEGVESEGRDGARYWNPGVYARGKKALEELVWAVRRQTASRREA